MQKVVKHRAELAEQRFMLEQRCDFVTRVKADQHVGFWAASRLDLEEAEAAHYAHAIVETSISSKDGRGGFKKVVADLSPLGVHIETVRTQYDIAMAALKQSSPIHLTRGSEEVRLAG
ncbi:ATPase inhibitor subunit zeta [Fulvimarina sp. 2208YS6-2-32]|uniref:ATPase inhibitor subunit zeta n=1 Tax=Fulvimarina uroteuthidis TaxID=3098149 RepID=A0ABU5I0B1_9HYPH|nr:ATPase inhibitor subunit zeta [Fulvimarina sp. 2208YS6-2-32]MDY8108823.1 ATPase inhibitor subunit zeta [Fulvimarina sp. 2208YS6-2-32]